MSDIAISCENLGKRYRIGQRESYKALRDTLTDAVSAPFRRLRGKSNGTNGHDANASDNTFWALRNVSFEVKHGDVVGIIGRNGAGKSTLLKILSRITKPTEGHVKINGRVGSLLEVGTGFHPELTGRENIFLNGTILGMKRKEIERKFDEIVAFAEIEKFLDTPVKRYSSGMYVRLAFAVAAHLEPEILVIDEVLAVGDAAFQKKCLSQMGDAAKGGRTVLFVSHQMNQIRRLCEKCIWLNNGQVQEVGSTVQVISAYEAAMTSIPLQETSGNIKKSSSAQFLRWEILEPHHEQQNILRTTGPTRLRFVMNISKPIHNGHHGIVLYNNDNQIMWSTALDNIKLEAGQRELIYDFSILPLRPGNYHWLVSMYDDGKRLDEWICVPEMIVASELRTHPMESFQGILNLPWQFHVK